MSKLTKEQIIRAWVDPEYRASLSEEERAFLPPNPAGDEVSLEDLEAVAGGSLLTDMTLCLTCEETIGGGTCGVMSFGCCGPEQKA